jgi:splicing factor 3A subunit 3
MEAEQRLDAPLVFDESDGEDEEVFCNPKGLPLGWDGKPIPYWLYKLHGLSVEYKCEICGNRSYWGALSFERHFFDQRHMSGLKALGIPPTRHFVYVTGVNEAIALFEKIKTSLVKEVWQPGDEEIETEDGLVMSRKIYQDLVRQGILKPKTGST